jgi:hypothetical protein
VIKKSDVMAQYLSPRADIVHSADFEIAVTKVLQNKESRLNRGERALLRRFERQVAPEAQPRDDADDVFADEILRADPKKSPNSDLRWIPTTSNDVERLFSTAGRVLTPESQAMNPVRLETLLFLEYNKGCIPSRQPSRSLTLARDVADKVL